MVRASMVGSSLSSAWTATWCWAASEGSWRPSSWRWPPSALEGTYRSCVARCRVALRWVWAGWNLSELYGEIGRFLFPWSCFGRSDVQFYVWTWGIPQVLAILMGIMMVNWWEIWLYPYSLCGAKELQIEFPNHVILVGNDFGDLILGMINCYGDFKS